MSGCVAAVDLATGAVIAHISDGDPLIAITPDGTKAFVAGGASVKVIDLSTHSITATIPVGADALAINPSGTTVWVALTSGPAGTLTPIDIATNAIGAPIALAYPPSAIAITGGTGYVTQHGGSYLMPVDLAAMTTGIPFSISAGAALVDIAISSDGSAAFISYIQSGAAAVIEVNLPALTEGYSWPISASPATPAVAVTPDGTKVYATDNDDYVISVHPLVPPVGTDPVIPVATGPSDIAITPDGLVAVVVAGGGIQLINLTSATVVSTVALGGGHQVAITPDGTTAYVTEAACPSPSVGWRTGMIP